LHDKTALAPGHCLARAQPLDVYPRASWWICDACGVRQDEGAVMWHCTHGCQYDLCGDCHTELWPDD
jgi:hypothetical protein